MCEDFKAKINKAKQLLESPRLEAKAKKTLKKFILEQEQYFNKCHWYATAHEHYTQEELIENKVTIESVFNRLDKFDNIIRQNTHPD